MSEAEGVSVLTGPRWKILQKYAADRLQSLQGGYLAGVPGAKADLASLRNIDAMNDERLLLAWETVFADAPPALIGRGDEITDEERALVTAMHLYAAHQQSKGEAMHVAGVGLGKAIRRLANPNDAENREKPVMRRYHALMTATSLPEITHHLRALVKQMRAEGIALDYALLVRDLLWLSRETTRARVRLAWARELTRSAKKESSKETGGENGEASAD